MLVMFCSQLGYYIIGKVSLFVLQQTTKEKLLRQAPDSLLVAIRWEGNQQYIEWEEEEKEFSFKGRMYDVVKQKYVKGQKVFFCFDDTNEDCLLEKMNSTTKNNQRLPVKNLSFPGVNLVFNPIETFKLVYPPLSLRCLADIYYDVFLPQQIQPIAVPPPRM